VRIYEVAGEALGKQLGICAHEPRRQSRATDEGEQRFLSTSDDLVGRKPPIWECYFHVLTQPSYGSWPEPTGQTENSPPALLLSFLSETTGQYGSKCGALGTSLRELFLKVR
jgi:hypothetical protein